MLVVDELAFSFSATQQWRFSFSVASGKTLAVTGTSGAGKSTLFHLIAGFHIPNHGRILFNNDPLTHLAPAKRPVSMLFQENNLFEHLSAAQNVALGIHPGLKLSREEWQKVNDILVKVGLADQQEQLPKYLSGGQRQRVALARCLLRQQPLLLLDEPFTALDTDTKYELLTLIKQFQLTHHITMLLISHDAEERQALADYFIDVDAYRS